MKVLGISGSLRRDSHNRRLLHELHDLLPEDVELELWDGLKAVPPYDEDDDADAVLFATPEYNSSIPGVLKNALDWASRPLAANPLRNKPVAVVGASTGMFGAVWAQAELRKVLGAMGARVVDLDAPVPRAHETLPDGLDEAVRERLEDVCAALCALVREREQVAA
jgi:chromate reductase